MKLLKLSLLSHIHLELDQQILEQENSYWINIEARRATTTKEIPHGIRYSLTLHEPYGKRLLGYENAHAFKLPKKFKFAGQRLAYGHKHRHICECRLNELLRP